MRPQPAARAWTLRSRSTSQQFRPMFRAEYYFISNVCDLTKDAAQATGPDGRAAIKAAARQIRRGPAEDDARGLAARARSYPDPQQAHRGRAGQVRPTLLTSAQQERYRQGAGETSRQSQAGRSSTTWSRSSIRTWCSTSEQRDEARPTRCARTGMTRGASRWRCSRIIDNFFPNIPDQVVVPFLTEHQKAVWRRIPKNPGRASAGSALAAWSWEPDPLDDPELAEAAARKPRPRRSNERAMTMSSATAQPSANGSLLRRHRERCASMLSRGCRLASWAGGIPASGSVFRDCRRRSQDMVVVREAGRGRAPADAGRRRGSRRECCRSRSPARLRDERRPVRSVGLRGARGTPGPAATSSIRS